MILTLTTNAALDRIFIIDEFRPGTIMRPPEFIEKVGGKGLDVSVVLRAVGLETVAIGAVAGERGRRLAALLEGYGIRADLIWLEGETRLAHVIIEQSLQRHSHIIAGRLPVTPAAVDEFLTRLETHLPQSKWVAAGGSLPQGMPHDFYRQVVQRARQAGRPILLDITGPPVQSILELPPDVLKLNRREFVESFDMPAVDKLDQLVDQAGAVAEKYHLPALVLTCGEEGFIARTPAGSFHVTAPTQTAINAAGAGDAASAGLVWRLSQGDGWPKALRWAAAISAASVLTPGTADCNFEDAERLLPQVTLKRLPP